MSLQTTVGIAKIGTKSLRATVPEGIVAYLELQSGDRLDWKMEIIDGGRAVLVRKAKPTDIEATKIALKYARTGAEVKS